MKSVGSRSVCQSESDSQVIYGDEYLRNHYYHDNMIICVQINRSVGQSDSHHYAVCPPFISSPFTFHPSPFSNLTVTFSKPAHTKLIDSFILLKPTEYDQTHLKNFIGLVGSRKVKDFIL